MPSTPTAPKTAIAVALALVIVAGCASTDAPSSPPASSASPSVAGSSPTPPAIANSSASAAPSGRPSTPASADPVWHQIGTITATEGGDVSRVEASAIGYVAPEEGDGATVDWLSTDGRSWQAGTVSDPIPPCPPVDTSCSPWATSSGWEAIVSASDTISVLRSADGVTWNTVDLPADVAADLDGTGWAAPDGTLLLLLDPSHQGTTVSLGAVTAAGAWQAVPYPAGCPSSYDLVLTPSLVGEPHWAISDGTKTCVSTDLQTWTAGKLPVKAGYPIVDWISTSAGILAIGSNTDCICRLPFQLLSADGVHWTKVRAPIGTQAMVDGPAGTIGITDNREAVVNQFVVWRLTP